MKILRTLLLIRRFEEALIQTRNPASRSATSTCTSGRSPPGSRRSRSSRRRRIVTTHRNHGHLIARGADPKRLYAEIFGKATGINRGKGGTLHATVAEHGFPTTSSLVGGPVPIAVGSAFTAKQLGPTGVSVALFGDGALEEGVFYESVNIAAMRKVPVIFLCENNSPRRSARRPTSTRRPRSPPRR